ncbi:MAG TPA: hypothetical protein VIW24_31315 [Aldersonia sp.]
MPDFDTDLDRDWRQFRRRLADRLADLPKGARFELSCPDDARDGVYLDCRITGNSRIRIEVPVDSCPVDAARLRSGGWRQLRSGALVLEVGRHWADLAAAQAATLLRDEWGIVHPTFVDGLGARPEPRESRLHIGVEPRTPEHLQKLVDDALDSLMYDGLERDPCGCIRFDRSGMPSWLRVLTEENVLQFFTWLGPSEISQAAHVIAEANARCRGVQIAASEGRVFAALHVDASVFVEEGLARAVTRWLAFMRDHAGEIARELNSIAEVAVPAGLPPGLQCLLQLDPDASMQARDVATVCGNDRDAIVDYLRICDEQEATSRAAAAEAGDVAEAGAADHEANSWARTAVTLREALWLVVLGARRSTNG